ncbi:hypothetical protein KCP69_20875 [Salmonella enterica subsp. enterica]|nr:hypothetical protein KCP69_20875 [Salmonella enterica subsp. enterica]
MSKTDTYLFPQEQRVLFYNCFQSFADIGRAAVTRLHASRLPARGKFFIRSAFYHRQYYARVAHTFAGAVSIRDIANNRLGHVVFNVSRRFFLRYRRSRSSRSLQSADLPGTVSECSDEARARNRVAADTHAGVIAETVVGGLLNRFL